MNKFFAILLLLASLVSAQEIQVKVKTDSSDYQIGDYINLEYSIKHKKDIEIFFPSVKDSLRNLELVEQKKPVVKDDNENRTTQFQFTIIGFDSGDVTIPSFLISYKKSNDTTFSFVRTDSLVITVHTFTVDTSEAIRDVKKPLTVPFDYLMLLYWILGALALLLLIFFIYKKFFSKKKVKVEKKIILPNWQIALNELNELNGKQLWQKGEVKEYHSQITEIIRNYFEVEFKIKALEKTSFEIIEDLKNVEKAKNVLPVTEEFLSNADMVKFAKFIPLPHVNEAMMKQAIDIVKSSSNNEIEVANV